LIGRAETKRGIAAMTGAFIMAFEQGQDREDLSLLELPPPDAERDSSGRVGDRRPADTLIESLRARAPARQEHSPTARRTVKVPPGEDQQQERNQRGQESNKGRRRRFAYAAALLLSIPVLAGGALYWDYARHFETTDDAFIAARQFSIAPRCQATSRRCQSPTTSTSMPAT